MPCPPQDVQLQQLCQGILEAGVVLGGVELQGGHAPARHAGELQAWQAMERRRLASPALMGSRQRRWPAALNAGPNSGALQADEQAPKW